MKDKSPSMAGERACPSAPSRAPVCGVHWSEAETLARKKRTDQAQGLARKGGGKPVRLGSIKKRALEWQRWWSAILGKFRPFQMVRNCSMVFGAYPA